MSKKIEPFLKHIIMEADYLTFQLVIKSYKFL